MKNTKKLLTFFIFIIVLFAPIIVRANCVWREEIITSTDITQTTTGGCYGSEFSPKNKNEGICEAERPQGKTMVGSRIDWVCCCPATNNNSKEQSSLFEAPDLKIKIPGLEALSDITCAPGEECEIPWLGQYIRGIYNYAIAIAGILAAVVLMGGGVLWLISRGDASKITKAKELIIGSVIGLVILSGSYLILTLINPNLVNLQNISVKSIKRDLEIKLAKEYLGQTSQEYKTATCASAEELKVGVNFYATGYYKPKWEDTEEFRCVVAMQCTCPNGQDKTKNCDFLYGKLYPGYNPCKEFAQNVPYCNMTSSGTMPKDGDIAGPNNCTSTLPPGTKVCFNGKTYTITDSGGGIKGRRIDIWSGEDLKKAYSVTGIGKLTIGACK